LKLLFFFSFTIALCYSCKHKSINCGKDCDEVEEQIFQTGFNNTSISDITDQWKDIHGIDSAYNEYNNWDELDEHPLIGDFKINMEDGTPSQRGFEITSDPEDETNNVLRFYIKEPHIREAAKKKSRVQADVNSNNCIKEFYQTVRVYLPKDMAYLQEWDDSFYWLSIFEIWNNANWTKEKFPFRVNVNITKPEKGKVNSLRLHAKGDVNKRIGKWVPEWEQTAENFELPIGKWMTIEIYIKEGDNETGRFYLTVTPDGEEKQVVFNITNYTQHPDENCPDGFSHIHPLKFYTSAELTNYMKDAGKNLEIYWDDWSMWAYKKPEGLDE